MRKRRMAAEIRRLGNLLLEQQEVTRMWVTELDVRSHQLAELRRDYEFQEACDARVAAAEAKVLFYQNKQSAIEKVLGDLLDAYRIEGRGGNGAG